MRWRFPEVDNTTPQLDRCSRGHRPQASYGARSVISCTRCGEKIAVDTEPFFRNADTQREHEIWRAATIWNELRTRSSSR
ncbi:hypothetical protein E0H54_30955 [Rhizobium leguminosarum bv. viciae]|nr:hypothetical protein E0H54_30955 [Rhizobium leguminosarum bv. viciae]